MLVDAYPELEEVAQARRPDLFAQAEKQEPHR
jgi:hypothetical protein